MTDYQQRKRELKEELACARRRYLHLKKANAHFTNRRKCKAGEHEWKNLDCVIGGSCGKIFGAYYKHGYQLWKCLVCNAHEVRTYTGERPRRVSKRLVRKAGFS